METVQWKVEGMDCSNCAITIHKYLRKEGMDNVKVNFATGDVSFDMNGNHTKDEIAKGIHSLGYSVAQGTNSVTPKRRFLENHLQRFFFCLPFLVILLLPMVGIQIHFLMN